VDNNNQGRALHAAASSFAGDTQARFMNNSFFEGKVALLPGSASVMQQLALSLYV
jgi:hypothetical protein